MTTDTKCRCTACVQKDQLLARVAELEGLVTEFHRLGLVIETAVRQDQLPHHAAVLAVLKGARSALKGDSL